MGRPEPCILFAQTFVHSQLDEYVDEVLFAEPIVVTACEFLEQNASLPNPSMLLVGGIWRFPPNLHDHKVHSHQRLMGICQIAFLGSMQEPIFLIVTSARTFGITHRGATGPNVATENQQQATSPCVHI